MGARGGAVGWGTALQAEGSRVRFPMLSLESVRTMTLRSTQPLTWMSTKNISWGVKAGGDWADNHTIVLNSGSLNLLVKPSGLVQACNGIALPLHVTNRLLYMLLNPLTPELNPSAQRCLAKFFTRDFASWTVHFVNMCVKNQQMQQLFIQFIHNVCMNAPWRWQCNAETCRNYHT
jgi:hypothetical protein